MAERTGLSVKVRVENEADVRRALRRLPGEAEDLLKIRTKKVAESLAAKVRAAAVADSRQSALMAPTVQPKKGSTYPTLEAGGTSSVGRNHKPAYKILFGSEFGSHKLKQYRPHKGNASYWFFKTVDENQADTNREWQKVADEVVRLWSA